MASYSRLLKASKVEPRENVNVPAILLSCCWLYLNSHTPLEAPGHTKIKNRKATMRFRLIVLLLLSSLAKGQQQMTHEEQVVRTTYARLSYAVQVNEVHKAIADSAKGELIDHASLNQRLKAAELVFLLSDFKVGNVTDADIGQTKYAYLVTKPSGDSLDITHGTTSFTTDSPADGSVRPQHTESVIAMAQWHASQTISEDWEQPWAKLFPLIENSTWFTRYASFKAKVSFQGRSREYRAMFLFGHDPKSGAEYVVPGDTVAGLTGALHFFVINNAYPEALIEGGVGRDIPAVRDWLSAQATVGKAHDDNCDPATAKCGVSRQDLEKLEKLKVNKHLMKLDPRRTANPPRLENVSFHQQLHPMIQAGSPTSCAGFSTTNPHTGFIQEFSRHVNPGPDSNHTLVDVAQTSCTYSDGAGSTCNTACNVTVSSSSIGDTGPVTGFCHSVNKATKNDTQNGTGAGADCGGGVGGGVKECLGCLCGVSVSISSNGAAVSISSDGFFTANDGLGQRCAAQAQPTPTPSPTPVTVGGLPPNPCLNGPAIVSGPSGNFGTTGGSGNKPDCSPIIVDVTGDGFFLTDAAHGVLFDIANSGTPIQIAWTANANNAWLVLDRNGNSIINSGAEMFGNFTPQPSSARPNGFLALAVYDDPANGGNGDGVIDARDKIFSSLRLWVDANHDGISQPEELHTLPELGIYSISLDYSLSERTDQYGNVFRYKAHVNQGLHGPLDVGKTAYDVFLVAQ